MKKNNSLSGKLFQDFLIKSYPLVKLLFQNNTDFTFEEIDSKDKQNPYKTIRKNLLKWFKSNYYQWASYQSSLRGDFLYITKNGIQCIVDAKNYVSIQGTMKFSGDNREKFMKGIDSNIKYLLFHNLHLFNFSDNVLTHLSDKCKSNTHLNFINSIKDNYTQLTKIGTMTKSNFVELFRFFELGFGWKEFGADSIKYFISKDDKTNQLVLSSIDFEESLQDTTVDVLFCINKNDGYLYVYFYQGGDCVYILSQRSNFSSNCSFINKSFMKIVNKIEIPNL